MKVLLVDDDPAVRQAFSMMFRFLGWEAEEAASGDEGLGMAAGGGVDLYLVDYHMFPMDGLQFCRRLRESSRAPVFLLTGDDIRDFQSEALEAGATACLKKPIEFGELKKNLAAVGLA